MSEVIGFFGTFSADLCLYASLALQNTGKSVGVIDQSDDRILYGCIPTPDERLESVTYHGVDFMCRQPLLKWQDMRYDYVFVQLGQQPQELCLALCSRLVLVVDCERRNMDFYRRFMQESRLSMMVLLRGFSPDGVPVRELKNYFARGNDFIEKWMTLPINEFDEAYRIGLQYEQFKKFAYISSGMKKILVQLLRQMKAGSSMEIIRAVKRAKSGRTAAVPTSFRHYSGNGEERLSGVVEYGG